MVALGTASGEFNATVEVLERIGNCHVFRSRPGSDWRGHK
jgi:hypothetical protein